MFTLFRKVFHSSTLFNHFLFISDTENYNLLIKNKQNLILSFVLKNYTPFATLKRHFMDKFSKKVLKSLKIKFDNNYLNLLHFPPLDPHSQLNYDRSRFPNYPNLKKKSLIFWIKKLYNTFLTIKRSNLINNGKKNV